MKLLTDLKRLDVAADADPYDKIADDGYRLACVLHMAAIIRALEVACEALRTRRELPGPKVWNDSKRMQDLVRADQRVSVQALTEIREILGGEDDH